MPPFQGKRRLPNRFARNVRLTYELLLRAVVKLSFPFWQAIGLHLTVNHYYQPIPDTRLLSDQTWSRVSELPGIAINEDEQLGLLADFVHEFKSEYDSLPSDKTGDAADYFLNNTLFFGVDAEIYYCMIRRFRPRRIVEIGSGYSTLLASRALSRNFQDDPTYRCDFTAIEPDPGDLLRNGVPGLSRLIRQPVQDVPLDIFTGLAESDIMFIDSSHILRIGSDVQREYLEILPRLQPGVLVHVHDVFLPLEYPVEWVLGHYRFWNEQYLLQAFLAFNEHVRILWASCYMHVYHPELLTAAFKSYRGNTRWQGRRWLPASLWLRITRSPVNAADASGRSNVGSKT